MTTTPTPPPPDGWGLDNFLDTLAEDLQRLGIAAGAPDRRTVRYYATIGVLDKPATAGREARYTERHLAQLLALKRLQADGVRLAAIRTRIDGATTPELVAIATAGPQLAPAPPRTPEVATVRVQSSILLAPGIHLVLDDTTVSSTEAAALSTAAAGLLTRINALGLSPEPRKDSAHAASHR